MTRVVERTSLAARVGARLGSPLWLAVSVIVLVASVGLVATLSNYVALCKLGREHARALTEAHSRALERSIGAALGVADTLLDRLAPHATQADAAPEGLLEVLRDLATARPGVTWISASFANGTFVGVYRAPDGQLRGQDSRTTSHGFSERQFVFSEAGLAQQIGEKPTAYDPRTRGFYRLAAQKGTRTWTEPYPFLPSYRTGLSRVAPLYEEPGHTLRAVLTVDFDASALAQLLESSATRGLVRAVVTDDGALLGSSGVVLPKPAQLPRDRALNVSDVHDPVLSAASSQKAPSHGLAERSFTLGRARYFATTARVARLDDHAVALVSAVDEQQLYAHAQREAARGIVITAITALFALAFALALSANIARLRRARAEAEVAAAEARREADALGSYELLELLGRGAMGEVYRARHRLLSREAALKLIRIDEDEDPSEPRRLFFEEAQRLASMRSVHTVSVYDFGVAHFEVGGPQPLSRSPLSEDGRYFLAMELLDGLDLDALVRRFGRQPAARVAAILAQICDSLAEAHAKGLVHQDIKPANVFLCHLAEALDFVKVLDFGIARAVGPRGQRLSRSEGTPAFMSPEQILGEPVGPLSDLYAVGGVGFFLLSGTPPFLHGNVEDVQLAHVEDPIPELPTDVRRNVPPALTQLITRCLAKRAEHRPVSASVLAEAFRSIAQQCAGSFPDTARDAFWQALEEERSRKRASLPSLSSHVRTVLARPSAHNTQAAS